LDKAQELADIISIRDEVDVCDVELGVLSRQGAKERLKGKARVARGVLIDENVSGIRPQLRGVRGRRPERRRSFDNLISNSLSRTNLT
jgi:hypothetical protein